MSEAAAMRFVASRTSIPVPQVHEAYEKDGLGYIRMSKVHGHLLSEAWKSLTFEKRHHVVEQLRQYVQELQQIRGDFYGALWRLPSEDTFFKHFAAVTTDQIRYGPFDSRREYNKGLIEALRNSRPRGVLSESDQALAEEVLALNDEEKTFCRGDLHRGNILVDDDAKITGIIDWEAAGFSITGQDYFVCKWGARDAEWMEAVETKFSSWEQSSLRPLEKI
ncbi:kinase-like domain-containing protein [Phyllosticta citriasiana]|uniref:Kinase-like domain-containing protein n=1 Tax=Phyllosticta citriasiana TaxID=595635 RepID=A0ABR1KE62_9PEZI